MRGAHGVQGALRLALDLPWGVLSPPPAALDLHLEAAAFGRVAAAHPALAARARPAGEGQALALAVEGARATSEGAIVRLAQLTCREQAQTLAGARVALPRASLPPCAEGEYWCFELAGLAARDEAGASLGRIAEVVGAGAQVLGLLRGDDGREGLVPLVGEVVRRVDRAAACVTLRLPEGLWPLVAVASLPARGGRR